MSATGQIRVRIHEYLEATSHGETPLLARLCFIAAFAYFIWPFDLIPDFIPVIGYLDDILIVPFLIWLGCRIKERARIQHLERARQAKNDALPLPDHCPDKI